MQKAVILISGGIDSATCCAIFRDRGFALYGITFAYGQRHAIECISARSVASAFGVVEHKEISIDLRNFGGSSLTSEEPVPRDRTENERGTGIPSTYVPARNTIFLAYALGWAEVLQCRDIVIGANAVDYSGYPDCRPSFIAAFEAMANTAVKYAVEGATIKIHAPLIDLSKAEIIRRGTALGVDYGLTHSCYDPSPDGLACGRCDSCTIRRQGFEDAGVTDPTRYQS